MSLQQLRSNLREMEKLCGRVRSVDAEALETLVQPIRDRASAAIQEFLQIHSDAVNRQNFNEAIATAAETSHCMCLCFMILIMCFFYLIRQAIWLWCNGSGEDDTGVPGSPVTQTQLLLPEIPPEQNAAESWDSLAEVTHANPYRYLGTFSFTCSSWCFFFQSNVKKIYKIHIWMYYFVTLY